MVGRRGPSQAKFTTKELRELGTLPEADVVVDPAELALDPAYARSGRGAARRVARRNRGGAAGWAAGASPSGRPRRIHLRFFLRPVELLGGRRPGRARCGSSGPHRTAAAGCIGTGDLRGIEAQLVLRSVGYRGHSAGRAAVRRGERHGAACGGAGAAATAALARRVRRRAGSSAARPG